MSEQSQALEQRQQSVVKATPVPTALAERGVRIGRDEASGMAVVVIPPEIRERVNVLDPVSSFAQADPNWTPSVRVVTLNTAKDGPHFYTNRSWGNKLAPTKQGLELLAKAAGVLYTRTTRVPRDELSEGERFAYRATIGIRRSDGTIEELTRERGWNEEVEKAKIEDAVAAATAWENGQNTGRPKFPVGPARDAELRKRWLQELEHGPAKTESKAVLRAIRAALQIPHQFTPGDVAKPFVVVGYSFTPDYDDVETKRLLVAAGLNAQAALYGGRVVDHDLDAAALPPGPAAEGTPTEASAEAAGGASAGGSQQAAPGPSQEETAQTTGEEPGTDGTGAAPGPDEDPYGDEPEPAELQTSFEPVIEHQPPPVWETARVGGGAYGPKDGVREQGLTVGEIAEIDDVYVRTYLAVRGQEEEVKRAAQAWAAAHPQAA